MLLEMNESFYGFSSGNLGADLIVPPNHPSPHHLSTSGCFGMPSPGPNGSFGSTMSMMGLGSSSGNLDLAEGNTSGSSDREPPDSKVDIDDEVCPVCGDKVSGYHYGLLTCESCKGFFKRTVQNKKVYTCVGERSCHIDKSQRKRCPFCRFQKCLEVGMKLEAVRSDRMRGGRNKFGPMYKRDRARKLQALRTRQQVSYNPLGHSHTLGHSRSNNGKTEDSSNYALPPIGNGSLMYDFHNAAASRKTEMIQIPHLSSTNSPENLHLVSADTNSNSHAAASWSGTGSPNSMACNQNMALLNIGGMHLHGTRSPAVPLMDAGDTGQMALPRSVVELQMTLIDDKMWQDNLHALLHQQTYNQCEVDSFELLCKVLDQCSFLQVEWAKNSAYFKDLQVEDQSSLIQHSWSEMVILDFVYHRLFNNLPDETTLPNGQAFCFLDLAILGANTNMELLHSFTSRLRELKFDKNDYVCFKFLLLLRSDVPRLVDRGHVRNSQEHVQRLFLEHCIGVYPHMPERFSQLLLVLSELTVMANHGEEYLYYKHMTGAASTKTLLMELLSGPKRKH